MNLERLIRDWRPWLLVIFIAASVFILFYPAMGGEGLTSLSFGLELDGGTYLQLDPQGKVVTTGDISEPGNVSSDITEELNVPVDVASLGGGGYEFEIRGNVSDQEINRVFEERGIQINNIEDGLTQESLGTLRNAVQTRLDDALGVGAGATASLQQNLITGDSSVVVEVPGEREREGRIADIIRTEGTFELRVVMQDGNESHVLYGDQVLRPSVSAPRYNPDSETYDVSFELTETGAERFREAAIESGATQNPDDERLVMYFQEKEVFKGGIQPSLARDIESGSWQGGGLTVTGLNESRAEVVSLSLRSGELPAPVEIATSMTISPVEGERFKLFSLIIALISVIAVGFVIFNRYRDIRVAVPTMTIGLMEVLILLGFSSFFNFNIDLAFIAGLIAVIGTGMDDLIIIADEVQEHGKIRSADLYRKRLKRAFIVIGMAAVTTIGAMLPLAYFGLGRISSFAVVTIVGVIVGVLITRPAYGSILRELITEKG